MHSSEPITYIVSIIPGTVLAVKAYKQFTGERRLIVVPDNLYRVETKDYGAVTAVQVVFDKPLSTITDQATTNGGGWSDDIYVTFRSTIGPNIVDILKYLIDTYTDLDWDKPVAEGGTGSFNYVHDKLEKFPANFPILERKNTLTVLQEIAYQARCALWISNGVFYIKYLPEEPAADSTITASDLDADKGVEVELTATEDLVTKMVVKWRISWAPGATDRPKDKSEKTMILRHNVTRYGIQEEEYDWYIYNQPDSIYKCATFWLIRKSHTWKRIRFHITDKVFFFVNPCVGQVGRRPSCPYRESRAECPASANVRICERFTFGGSGVENGRHKAAGTSPCSRQTTSLGPNAPVVLAGEHPRRQGSLRRAGSAAHEGAGDLSVHAPEAGVLHRNSGVRTGPAFLCDLDHVFSSAQPLAAKGRAACTENWLQESRARNPG